MNLHGIVPARARTEYAPVLSGVLPNARVLPPLRANACGSVRSTARAGRHRISSQFHGDETRNGRLLHFSLWRLAVIERSMGEAIHA